MYSHLAARRRLFVLVVSAMIVAPAPRAVAADSAGRFVMPDRMDSAAKLAVRLDQLRSQYAPYQRDLAPRFALRDRIGLAPGTWLFCDDEKDVGISQGYFRTDFDDHAWQQRKLPEYREFARGWYRIHKTLPKTLAGRRAWISFEGVDYHAAVFVNGEKVGEHNGYFAPFSLEVTRWVRSGADNVVAVRVDNPLDSAHHPDSFAGKGSGTMAFNAENGTVQYSNGAGIWQPAYFETTGPVTIRKVRITPALPDHARVDVELDGSGDVRVAVGPANFEGRTIEAHHAVARGKSTCTFGLSLPGARLWSPESPWLYYCHVTVRTAGVVTDRRAEKFGLRTIVRDNDGTLRLNGRPRMLRGACSFGNFWLDAAAGNGEGIVRDILIFKAAHLEFTRVTVHVLPDLVYRLCDRYGLMVYEDNALQWDYPMDKDDHLLPEVREEAVCQMREMVDMLGNHPSIIIWSCMNEFYAKGYPKADPVFRRAMYDACRSADPSRPIVLNSGSPYELEGTVSEADIHQYPGWYQNNGQYFDPANHPVMFFSPTNRGIVSEYGGVALPDWPTWQERFPWAPRHVEDLWTPLSIPAEDIYRGLSFGDRIQASVLTSRIGTPLRAADWIAASQHQQALLARHTTDSWRKWRSHIAGYLFFHLIDPGPLAWPKTLVDCQRRPQRGYFELARCSQPLRIALFTPRPRIFGRETTEALQTWVFNDSGTEFRGRARVLLLSEAGKIEDEAAVDVAAPDGSSQQLAVRALKTSPRTKRENMRVVALLEAAGQGASGKIPASFDDIPLTVFPRPAKPSAEVFVYDPAGKTLAALKSLGVSARPVDTLSSEKLQGCALLVVGEDCLGPKVSPALAVAERGGRVVILSQPPDLPAQKATAKKPEPPSRWSVLPVARSLKVVKWNTDFVQADTSAAFLRGLRPEDFREWNEETGSVCHGGLTAHADLVPWITTGQNQAHVAMGYVPYGKGQILVCQLLLAQRASHDPVAAEILSRLVAPEKIAMPARVTLDVRLPVEARDGQPIPVDVTIANTGGEDADALLVTLDDRYQTAGRRKLRLAAGQTVRQQVSVSAVAPRSASADTPESVFMASVSASRGQFGALALLSGSRVKIVPLGGTIVVPQGEVVRRFDFGSPDSPVASGYTQVTPAMRFDAARGFGWCSDKVEFRDRGVPNDLVRDFHTSTADATFRVVLRNGDYTCVAVIGDPAYPLHPIDVRAQGHLVVDGLTTRNGQIRTAEFRVNVTEGVLDLTFHQREAGQKWEIGGLVIVKTAGKGEKK